MTEKAKAQAQPATVVNAKPAVSKTNVLAIVALIAGVAGLTVIPFVSSIVAVVTGHMARKEIRRTGEHGDGMALAGLITGYIGLGLSVVVAILLIAFLGLVLASGMNQYNY